VKQATASENSITAFARYLMVPEFDAQFTPRFCGLTFLSVRAHDIAVNTRQDRVVVEGIDAMGKGLDQESTIPIGYGKVKRN
jgi:hypothetical protein